MKLIIVYDNTVFRKNAGLKAGWGFSCLIQTDRNSVLFDAGGKGKTLINNMKKLNIDFQEIEAVVISHEHWDHSGGLRALSSKINGFNVYRLKRKKPSEDMHLINSEEPQKVVENVWTTGKVKGSVDEQSLILKGKAGWYVLVGCSHPGVEKILDVSRKKGEIRGIIGGLHGFNDFSLLEGFKLVCPTHCTKHIDKIQTLFPKIFVSGGVGKTLDV